MVDINKNVNVNVTDKGSLDKTTKAAEATAGSLSKVGHAATTANRAIANGAGAADAGARSFSKLASSVDNGIVRAYAGFAANIFALSVAFDQLRKSAQVSQVTAGLEYLGAKSGIALKNTAAQLQQVTDGAISAQQSLRATALLATAGFDTDAIKHIGIAASNSSIALGRDMNDALDRLSKGLVKLHPQLLDELGALTKVEDATAAYSAVTGKAINSLTQQDKKVAFSTAVLAELDAKFSGVTDAAGNTRGYEQLASSLDNLKVHTLGLLNGGLTPLASFLASSPLLITSSLGLFGSSISKQVLPGLYQASEQSKKALEDLKNNQKLALDDVETIRAPVISKTRQQKIAKTDPSLLGGLNRSKDYLTSYNELLDNSDLTLQKNVIIARHELTAALESYEKVQANSVNLTKAEQASLDKTIVALKVQKTELDQLTVSTNAYIIAREKADVLDNVRNKNLSGAKLGGVYSATKDALEETSNLSTKGITGLVSKASIEVAAFSSAAVTGAKAVGLAFLEFLPEIALAGLALGTLKGAFDWVTYSQKAKDYSDSLQNLNDVIKNLTKSSEEYQKIAASTATYGTRIGKEYEIAANSLTQLSQATQAYIDKKNALDKDSSFDLFKDSSIKSNGNISKADAKALESVKERLRQVQEIHTGVTGNVTLGSAEDIRNTQAATNALKVLVEAYNSSDPVISRVAKQQVEAAGGFEKITKSAKTTKDIVNSLNGIIIGFADNSLVNLGHLAVDLNADFATLNQTFGKLTTSLGDNSKYSDAIEGLTGIATKLREAHKEAILSGDTTAIGSSLSNIGAQTENFFDPKTAKLLDDYKKNDAIAQALSQKKTNAGGTLSNEDQSKLDIAQKYTKTHQQDLNLIEVELTKTRSLLQLKNDQEILGKAELEYAQARIAASSEYYALSGQGEKQKLQDQNAARNAQAGQLEIQKSILQVLIRQEEASIQALNTQLGLNSALTIDLAARDLQLKSDAAKKALAEGNQDTIKAANAELDVSKQTYDNLSKRQEVQDSIHTQQVQITALSTQQAAITATNLNNAQIAAKAALAEANIQKAILAVRIQGRTEQQKINVGEAQLASINEDSFIIKKAQFEAEKAANEDKKSDLQSTLAVQQAQVAIDLANIEREKASGRIVSQSLKDTKDRSQAQVDVTNLSIKELDIQTQLSEKRLLDFNYINAYIPKKQEVLNIIQKEFDAEQELLKARQDNYLVQAKIAAAKEGRELTPSETAAIALKAAREQYALSVQENGLRSAIITAEYSLLKAKAQFELEDLKSKRSAAKDARKDTSGIDNVISSYETLLGNGVNGVIDAALKAQKDLLDQSEKNQKANIKLIEAQVKTLPGIPNNARNYGFEASAKAFRDKPIDSTNTAQNAVGSVIGSNGEALDPTLVITRGQTTAKAALEGFATYLKDYNDRISKESPIGALVASIVTSFAELPSVFDDLAKSYEKVSSASSTFSEKTIAIGQALQSTSTIVAAIDQIEQNSAKVKEDSIDRQINAEKLRDGSSNASLQKIKQLEIEKDAVARKAFEQNKKIQMAQTVINTASAVMSAVATYGVPVGVILGTAMAALGAAELGIIGSTQYQSSVNTNTSPSSISIGTRSNSIDLGQGNSNQGGEQAYLQGAQGQGNSASNFTPTGRAYGGNFTPRAYGGSAYIVGEKGPEVVTPLEPSTISPSTAANSNIPSSNTNIYISAIDSKSFADTLSSHGGTIIDSIRDVANNSGSSFLEDVNTSVYNAKRA